MSAREKDVPSTKFNRATLALGLAQTLFWSATFYLIPALILDIERDTSWTKSEIAFSMTSAIVVSALCARRVGQLIDLGHGRLLMCAGAGLASLFLFGSSLTNGLVWFVACWAGIGACMAATLYEPCFSIITRHYGSSSRRIITHITLIAGFAGTVAFPAANFLSSQIDWRFAVQIFAMMMLFVGVPLAWYGIREIEKLNPETDSALPKTKESKRPASILFWLIAGAFTCGSINHTMILAHLLPLLSERGVETQFAVLAAMLIGPMQVVGRLLLMINEQKLSINISAILCFVGLLLATSLLWVAGASIALICLATSLHGAAWGLVSIARPTLIRETLGGENFGAVSGSIASISIFGIAVAPTLGAGLWSIGGYDTMLMVGITLSAIGCAFLGLLILIDKHNKLDTNA